VQFTPFRKVKKIRQKCLDPQRDPNQILFLGSCPIPPNVSSKFVINFFELPCCQANTQRQSIFLGGSNNNKLCAWRHNMSRPSSPVGAQAPRVPPSRRNVAVLFPRRIRSHAEVTLSHLVISPLFPSVPLRFSSTWPLPLPKHCRWAFHLTSANMMKCTAYGESQNKWKKRSERRKHCARAGCSKVRTPPARQPQTYKHTDRTDYNTLRRS